MSEHTEAELIAIRKAYASGITRVSYDGKTTEYRSLAEMERIIARIESSLARQASRPLPVAGYATFRRS